VRLICVLMLGLTGVAACAAQYHVAPQGDDAAAGTPEAPWRTPHRALAADPGVQPGDTVFLHAGGYDLAQPLVLTPAHSGTEDAPVTIAAWPGDRVVLRGSRPVTGWEPWRDGIWVADLAAQGMAGTRCHQLFYRGTRQALARHPDFDPEHPRSGGFVYMEDGGPRGPEQFQYAPDDIPFDAWGEIPQAEVVTVLGLGWNFAITPVLDLDPEHRIVTTRRVRRNFERMNRYFVQNVLDALDAPGEWFLDYATDRLYFMPPDGAPADGDVRLPLLDSVIELRGRLPYPHQYLVVGHAGGRDQATLPADAPAPDPIAHVVLRGLTVEQTRQSGIVLTGARDCAVIGCIVSSTGNVGINLGAVSNAHEEVGNPRIPPAEGFYGGVAGGGQNILFNDPCLDCRVEGCDVSACGADGIFVYGDRNLAENNHVHDIGLYDKDCAAINLWGEGNVARRNTLHDVPRNAVFLKGVSNVAELNEIRWTMLETCDGGAVRMCQRNLVLRGNVIRHNRIRDTIGYGYPRNSRAFEAPYYSWGVYLDDFTCGTTVHGNIIARVGRAGVMVHGGSDCAVTGNVVVDAPLAALEQAPIRDDPIAGNAFARNTLVVDGGDSLVYRSTKWVEGSLVFARNLVWPRDSKARVSLGPGGGDFEDWQTWMARGLDDASVVAPPQFIDEAADDYRLAEDSPAWQLGFEAIPVEQIGYYQSPQRASWPIEMDAGPPREKLILHAEPARPILEDFEIETVGRPPRHGDSMADGDSRIVVTDQQAATGQHSLEVRDAAGLRAAWLPRIFYPVDFPEGQVRLAFDVRLSGESPPQLYVDPRQYSDTGGAEYLSGPMLTIDPDGQARSRTTSLARLPLDQWCRIELVLTLGEDAPQSTPMTLTVPGVDPVLVGVPHASAGFRRLERVVFASLTDGPSVFWLDNIAIEPIEP